MPSAYDLYTFYLDAADLRGQSHSVKITAVKVEPLFDPIAKREQNKLVVYFHARKKPLPLNKTQVAALIEITGSDDYSRWIGAQVTLTPATTPNKKQTIAITPAQIKREE